MCDTNSLCLPTCGVLSLLMVNQQDVYCCPEANQLHTLDALWPAVCFKRLKQKHTPRNSLECMLTLLHAS